RTIDEAIAEPLRLDSYTARHRQRLPERLPVPHQRQVDREFQNGAGADRSRIFQSSAQPFEDWSRPRRVRRFGAHEPDQLSLSRGTSPAAHRAFDDGGAFTSYRTSG